MKREYRSKVTLSVRISAEKALARGRTAGTRKGSCAGFRTASRAVSLCGTAIPHRETACKLSVLLFYHGVGSEVEVMSTVFRMVASCDRLERKHVFSERENRTQVSVLRDIAKIALRCRFCDLYEESQNFRGVCRALRVQYAPAKFEERGRG